MEKIKIAFIKFCGLAAGGTEKALQTIAANLPKDRFEVDYYYCDAAPYIGSDYKHIDTDPYRKAYMENKNVNLVKFNVAYKDVRDPTHKWIDTNFWEMFDETRYDIIQTGRAGHPEYPFTQINSTPQVDLITLPGMAENKVNVVKTIHISKYQADSWVKAGGNPSKIEIIPLFDELPTPSNLDLRKKFELENKFVFGLHQRDDDGIFSPIPLTAFKRLESEFDNVAFLLLGGSSRYKEQAATLELQNFYTLPHTGDRQCISKFLNTLNVYAHGRSDGETFSLAISEAMSYGLPVISHVAPAMGHAETIGEAGIVADSLDVYVNTMKKLVQDKDYYKILSNKAAERFQKHLSLDVNIGKFVALYEQVYQSNRPVKADEDWLTEWLEN